MFPYTTQYNPYGYTNFPVPDIFGEYPAALTYNGRIFARRDNPYQIGAPPNAPPSAPWFYPPQNLPQPQTTHKNHTSEKATSTTLSISDSRAPTPNLVQQPSLHRAPRTATTVTQQMASEHAPQQPQHFPSSCPPGWPLHAMQHNVAAQNSVPYYTQPPFCPAQQTPLTLYARPPFFTAPNNLAHFGYGAAPHLAGQSVGAPNLVATNLQHKCGACGRPRSAKYHHKHPIQPGRSPASTICGKCQKRMIRMDHVEDESSDGHRATKHHRQSSSHQRRRGLFRRSHSETRKKHKSKAERNDKRNYESDNSQSSSSYVDRGRPASFFRRTETPSIEGVRLIEAPRAHPRSTQGKTVYVESVDCADESDASGYHQPYYSLYPHRNPSRAATPMSRTIHRERSLPGTRTPIASIRQDYFDGFPDYASYQAYTRQSRPASREHSKPPGIRSVHPMKLRKAGRAVGTVYSQDDSDSQNTRPRNRSIERYSTYDAESDDDIVEVQETISRVPSPSVFPHELPIDHHDFPRSSRNDDAGDVRHPCRVNKLDTNTAKVAGPPQEAASHFHQRGPADDYDWYDEDGMRVRVREI